MTHVALSGGGISVASGAWGNLSQKTLLVLVGGIPLLFVAALLAVIGVEAFRNSAENFSVSNFQEVYADPYIYKVLLNTICFSVISVFVAIVCSVPMAWLVERTNLAGRSLVFPVMTLGILLPGFATAMGWLALFHQRVGMLSQWIASLMPDGRSPVGINNIVGMGFVQGLSLSGLLFIMTASSFRAMDPSLEESAEAHGLSLIKRLRLITIPLMWPSILAAALYAFTIAFGSFDVPALIGMGSNIFVFSTFIYEQARPEGGAPQYGLAAATSFLILALALVFSYWYLCVIRRASRYSVVTGKGYRPKLVGLSRRQMIAAWSFIGTVATLAIGLPLLALIWTSLNRYFVLPSLKAFQNVSLDAYRSLSFVGADVAIKNTFILVLAVPTATVIFSLVISWVIVRSQMKGVSRVYDAMAFLPHALPNIILALGAMILGLHFVPFSVPFYGTIFILIAVYIVERLGFGTRVYNGALLQIHRELEEAGSVFGLSKVAVICRILIPLIAPAIIYSWVWIALLVYRELTAAAVLASKDNVVLSTFIWQQWQQDTGRGAAMSIVMIVVMVPLIVLYFRFGRRYASKLMGT
jgi:iron(III) transport system permease protein